MFRDSTAEAAKKRSDFLSGRGSRNGGLSWAGSTLRFSAAFAPLRFSGGCSTPSFKFRASSRRLLRPGAQAFTRLDLVVLLGLLCFMATWLGCSFFGERGRTANCAQKLAALGTAMQNFADDHNGALPAASMEQPYQAWDSQMAQYLPRRLVKNGLDPAFRCPSDRLDRTRPRSYAMSGHNMGWENWPPGPEMRTGVGLTWTRANMQRLLGEDMVAVAQTNSSLLARIKVAMVPAPAETLLLTEAIHAANNLKDIDGATVSGSGLQMDGLKADQRGFHYGAFNYLMVDGRIEALSPFLVQTLSGNAGIWTVKAGD